MAKTQKSQDPGALVDRFLPVAKKVTRLTVLRADPTLAMQNVGRGVEAVMRQEIRIRRDLPKVDASILRALPDLAAAVVFAAAEAERADPVKQQALRPKLARARALRRLLLTSARGLAASGLIRDADVSKAEGGLGPLDSARDCVTLAALFQRIEPAARKKTPVTAADIDEAALLGEELCTRLKAVSAKRKAGDLPPSAIRDQLWSLLLERHDQLWRVGAYLFGRDVDRRVPALQASRGQID